MNKEQLAEKIWNIEGFSVEIEGVDKGYAEYKLIATPAKNTVAEWRKSFRKRYPEAVAVVQKGNGRAANGNMILKNVRKSYGIDEIRKEFEESFIELELLRSMRRQALSNCDSRNAFEVLGVAPEADFDEVRNAYRQLCRFFHEDRIQHFGLHPDLIAFATTRMQEINAAYQEVRAARNIDQMAD